MEGFVFVVYRRVWYFVVVFEIFWKVQVDFWVLQYWISDCCRSCWSRRLWKVPILLGRCCWDVCGYQFDLISRFIFSFIINLKLYALSFSPAKVSLCDHWEQLRGYRRQDISRIFFPKLNQDSELRCSQFHSNHLLLIQISSNPFRWWCLRCE